MKKRKKRRSFSPEFKAKAVSLCRTGERSIRQVAEDLDLVETAVRRWVSQTEVDAGKGSPGALTSEEREELAPQHWARTRARLVPQELADFISRITVPPPE